MKENVWLVAVCGLIIGGIVGYLIVPSTRRTPVQPAPAMVAADANKAIVRQLFVAADQGNLDGIDALLATDYVFHFAGNPQRDKPAHRQLVAALRTGFPDVKHTLEDQIVEGDKIATRGFFEGTQNGEFQGVKATGKKVKVTFIFIDRISGGKIAEEWVNLDSSGLLQQIGALPTPGGSR